MKNFRIIGNNVRFLLQDKHISHKDFCNKLNYSEVELAKLLEGRLALFTSDIVDMAKFFNVSEETLTHYCSEHDELSNKFSSMGNKEFVLDCFDLYCNLKELMGE